jgi:pSer/pThr/pTyr-binding forkhead associated (FHA) protein
MSLFGGDIGLVAATAVFVVVIAVLLYKIFTLSKNLVRRSSTPVKSLNRGRKPAPSATQQREAPPPPWAGGADAKTTVFVFPTLLVKDSSMVEHTYRLNFEDFTIGRSADNQLVIPRGNVAPHHARISLSENGYMIEDLGSVTGTLVNGERINHARPLSHMDRVTIGDTDIMFKASQ